MKLNEFKAIGNLVRDAEIVNMPNGKPKQIFTIAINDDYKKSGTEEWIKRPYFIDCYIVGKEYKDLTKGKKILINGKIVTRNYESNGAKKKITLIEVFTLDFIQMKDSSDYERVPAKEVGKDIDDMTDAEVPF